MKSGSQKRKTTIKGAVENPQSEPITLQEALDQFRLELREFKTGMIIMFIEYLAVLLIFFIIFIVKIS